MIYKQETLNLSPYMSLYDLIIPKNILLRQINELVDFSFIMDELKTNYCLDNGRNAIPPIRMFKYLLLKSIHDLSDVEKCKICPIKDGCYKEGAKTKACSVSIKSTTHKEQANFQETEEFKTLAKNRYKIEAKNSELKNAHGYHTAKSKGLFGIEKQSATTIFAVNLKRVLKLLSEKE